jgi:hypothetical protein
MLVERDSKMKEKEIRRDIRGRDYKREDNVDSDNSRRED